MHRSATVRSICYLDEEISNSLGGTTLTCYINAPLVGTLLSWLNPLASTEICAGRKTEWENNAGECNQNNETANSNPCEHICLDLHDGTYECSCFYGFTLAVDGYSCAKLPQAAPQLPQPPAEPASPPRATATQLSSSVLLGAKDNGTDKVPSVARGESGAEEDEAGFSLQRHRHLGGGEQQNRKLSGSTTAATKGSGSGEILSGAGGGERERALVESSAPAIAAKRRQVASREPTSGAEAKVAVEEEEAAERSLGGDQFGRGTKSTHLDNNNNNSDRNGVTQEEQSQSAETNRQPTRRSRQQQAIGNAKGKPQFAWASMQMRLCSFCFRYSMLNLCLCAFLGP